MKNEIDVVKLTVDERLELCKYLLKSGYAVWLDTKPAAPGSKTKRTVAVYERRETIS